jgi:hypothetical protein
VRLGVLERGLERGEIERRGNDRGLEGVRDLAAAEICRGERERPRSGDTDGMGVVDVIVETAKDWFNRLLRARFVVGFGTKKLIFGFYGSS